MMDVKHKLYNLIRKVFDQPDLEISTDTTANDVDGWDSLSHAVLISAVESVFGISFSRKEIMTIRNVGEMAACIHEKLSHGVKFQ